MAHRVFLCESIHPAARARLAQQAEILTDPADLPKADGAINRNLQMDAAWLSQCPNLKVIGVHGTGTDGVDLVAAAQRGILVCNAPGENARSVAELIVAYALLLSRQIPQWDRAIQAGVPVVNGGGTQMGQELTGKTFGMIGCGTIALLAADILCKGFSMEPAGYSPSLTPEKAAALGIRYCASPAEVFACADVVNIGVKLVPETAGLVDRELLSHAKPGCVLINTARGAVVDEAALYEALTNGTLAAAACDVFQQEPPERTNPLVTLPNFLATPHIGANTEEALYRVGMTTVEQVLAVLNGDAAYPLHRVI